jgi:methylenetetrahydrofolate dehydrogenase (NADP+)/methenyltetrahydrofolate cyclohydrolase
MVKEGSTLIDVTSMKVDGKVVGDVKVDEDLQNKIAWLSPVPGGVGPVTIACLLRNLML